MTKPVYLGARGSFKIIKTNKDGEVIQTVGPCKNVITDTGIATWLFSTNRNQSLTVTKSIDTGTGTSEIQETSNNLGSPSGTRQPSSLVSNTGVDNQDGTYTQTVVHRSTWPFGSKVGTYSEIGIFNGSGGSADNMGAGQLIKDEFGDPTTVTVLSDEQLSVEYTLEFTFPNVEQNLGSEEITINGETYTVTKFMRGYGQSASLPLSDNSAAWSRAVPPNFYINGTNFSTAASTPSVSRSITFSGNVSDGYTTNISIQAFPSAGNLNISNLYLTTGWGGTNWSSTGEAVYRFNFSPALPKTNEEVFEFSMTSVIKFNRD